MTIFDLIDAGRRDGVRDLLAREPDAAATRDPQGLSALMRAFYRGGGPAYEANSSPQRLRSTPGTGLLVGESEGLPASGRVESRRLHTASPRGVRATTMRPRSPSSTPAPIRT